MSVRCYAAAALAGFALLGTAKAAEVPKEDDGAITACLDLAARKAKAAPPTKDELDETPGPEGRLAAAVERAGHAKESCIGAVAVACVHKAGNMSNATLNECYAKETTVWDQRLNSAYRTVLAKLEKEAADNLRKTQRAWITWRDASCKQPYLVFQGTMAGPMESWCALELTARQSIWMEGWAE
jgi:uncharacterized protein YecT (DUF1311 family)